MAIKDDIDDAQTVAELQLIWDGLYATIKTLKKSIKDDESARAALSEKISIDKQTLSTYGDVLEIRKAFYTKLGELHKGELTGE
jgi:hypothetical protein